MTDPCCHFHPDKPANHCCRNCLNMVCDACLSSGNSAKNLCPSCLKAAQWNRRRIYVSGIAILIVVFALGVFFTKKYKYKILHYKYATVFDSLYQSYLDDPCNSKVATRFVIFLHGIGEDRDAVRVTEEFVEKCDKSPDVQQMQVSMYYILREYDKVLDVLVKLLAEHPENTDYKVAVAHVYDKMGKYQAALGEYQKILNEHPDLSEIMFEMVEVNEKMGRYCDNILLLEQYRFYFSTPMDLDSTKEKLAALYAKSECSDVKATVQAYLKSLPPKKAEVANVTKEVKRSHQALPVFKTYEDTTPPSKQDENKNEKKIRPNERVPGLSFGF